MLNQVVLMGRLTRNIEIRYAQGSDVAIGRFALAVDRDYTGKDGAKQTDFINCIAFKNTAEFISKWFKQGSMIAIVGSIQTGSYVNKDGVKVYTTDVIVKQASFTGEKSEDRQTKPQPAPGAAGVDGFMNIPDGIDELPFD